MEHMFDCLSYGRQHDVKPRVLRNGLGIKQHEYILYLHETKIHIFVFQLTIKLYEHEVFFCMISFRINVSFSHKQSCVNSFLHGFITIIYTLNLQVRLPISWCFPCCLVTQLQYIQKYFTTVEYKKA